MELKRRFDVKTIFVIVSWLLIIAYLWIGLMPVEAAQRLIAGKLEIPSISLSSDVTEMAVNGARLETPDELVGSYSSHKNKTLLVGHSTTAFTELKELKVGEIVNYNNEKYLVVDKTILGKAEISMKEILAEAERETIVLMTCSGTLLSGGDATHRLIITAVKV